MGMLHLSKHWYQVGSDVRPVFCFQYFCSSHIFDRDFSASVSPGIFKRRVTSKGSAPPPPSLFASETIGLVLCSLGTATYDFLTLNNNDTSRSCCGCCDGGLISFEFVVVPIDFVFILIKLGEGIILRDLALWSHLVCWQWCWMTSILRITISNNVKQDKEGLQH